MNRMQLWFHNFICGRFSKVCYSLLQSRTQCQRASRSAWTQTAGLKLNDINSDCPREIVSDFTIDDMETTTDSLSVDYHACMIYVFKQFKRPNLNIVVFLKHNATYNSTANGYFFKKCLDKKSTHLIRFASHKDFTALEIKNSIILQFQNFP